MISGSVYGVALNDRREREIRADTFEASPYVKGPQAPILYIKPRTCLALGGATVSIPPDLDTLVAAPTVALLFGNRPGVPVAAALAIDVSEASDSYYRPAIRQKSRDGFLPMGEFAALPLLTDQDEIATSIGNEQVHCWRLGRLHLDPRMLIAELSTFMTLADGDVLLIGLPGDAPRIVAGQSIRVEGLGLPPVTASFRSVSLT